MIFLSLIVGNTNRHWERIQNPENTPVTTAQKAAATSPNSIISEMSKKITGTCLKVETAIYLFSSCEAHLLTVNSEDKVAPSQEGRVRIRLLLCHSDEEKRPKKGCFSSL